MLAKRGKKFDMRKQNVVEVDEQGAAAGCQPHPVAEKQAGYRCRKTSRLSGLLFRIRRQRIVRRKRRIHTVDENAQLRICGLGPVEFWRSGNWLAKPVTAEPTSSPVSSPCCCVIAAIRACVSSVFAA